MNKGRQAKGEKNGRHKLTLVEARAIRQVFTDLGIPRRFLADTYGISRDAIDCIVRGKRWRETT